MSNNTNQVVYVPQSYVRERKFDWGTVLNLDINVQELGKICKQYKTEKGTIRLKISPLRQVKENGITHSLSVDTWVPDSSKKTSGTPKPQPPKPPKQEDPEEEDVPF